MLGGELVFHFINVVVMTVLIAPLILWRYRRAVLAGMMDRGGAALPLAPVVAPATSWNVSSIVVIGAIRSGRCRPRPERRARRRAP